MYITWVVAHTLYGSFLNTKNLTALKSHNLNLPVISITAWFVASDFMKCIDFPDFAEP
jgi:hypothetical protein